MRNSALKRFFNFSAKEDRLTNADRDYYNALGKIIMKRFNNQLKYGRK